MAYPLTRPLLVGSRGMVAATHWLAAGTGMAMLERGGNAFDAAVAGGLVLQVVEPHLNGPGGEVPILFHLAGSGTVRVVDGQGPLPAAASVAAARALGIDLVPGTGLLGAVVPGAFGAWTLLAEHHGRLRLRDLIEPAIAYAGRGFPLLASVADSIAACETRFSTYWPTSAQVFMPGGRVPQAGSWWSNPALAGVYGRVLKEAESGGSGRESEFAIARKVFYEGFVAEAIDKFCSSGEVPDGTGNRHRAFLSGSDLSSWQASFEDPCRVDYQGATVYKTGPWGQGPVFLQQLRILEGFDLGRIGVHSPELVHLVTESAKLAFADREAFYGDPRQVDVPLGALLSQDYAGVRRGLIGDEASGELRPGSPGGRPGRLAEAGELPAAAARAQLEVLLRGDPNVGGPTLERAVGQAPGGQAPGEQGGQGPGGIDRAVEYRGPSRRPDAVGRDTCQIDTVDSEGNMVAATPSGAWLHGSPVVPGLGFPLSTRAQMCWLEEGLPASFVGGRRPRTTLSPTMVLRDGDPWLAFGTPGGDQQDQWTLGFFLRRVHGSMDLQEAIEAPAFHTTHFPSSFYPREAHPRRLHLEGRWPSSVVGELRSRGHEVVVEDDWSLGRVCAVEKTGVALRAAADPRRGQAYAAGR